MRAQHYEIRRYPDRHAADANLAAAAAACRFRVIEVGSGYARLRCGLSWWSWGESVEVHASGVNGALVVEVHSSCILPTQVEDMGKNRQNVQRLFEALEVGMGAPTGDVIPICARCGYSLVGIDEGMCPECGNTGGQKRAGTPFQASSLFTVGKRYDWSLWATTARGTAFSAAPWPSCR
jgi:rubrerythrin